RSRKVILLTALLMFSLSGLSTNASAQTPNPGDNYFNTSQNPVTNQLESMAASPDQANYAIANNQHGEHREALGPETRMTSGGQWPAIVPPTPVQLDARSARAVDAVTKATGAGGASGSNLLSGNVASTAMAVGWQQAIARAQLPESMMPMAKELQNQ